MSHIHNYDDLVDRMKTLIDATMIVMKDLAPKTQSAVLARTILDALLDDLGIKIEPPIPYEPSDD